MLQPVLWQCIVCLEFGLISNEICEGGRERERERERGVQREQRERLSPHVYMEREIREGEAITTCIHREREKREGERER